MSALPAAARVLLGAAVALASLGAAVGCAPSSPGPEPRRATGTEPPGPPAGWQRVLQQDFAVPAPLGAFEDEYPGWAAYDGSPDTSRTNGRPGSTQGVWRSATTTAAHDGVWDCRLHTLGSQPQVCAMTPTPDGAWWAGTTAGRYSVRFRADAVAGYKLAFLLWPDSDRWSDGEIDFPEGSLDDTVLGSSHDVTGTPQDNAWLIDTRTRLAGRWHTAVIERTATSLRFTLDGRTWSTRSPDALPAGPMHWALQVETELSPTAPPQQASGHVLVDWVTVDVPMR